MILNEESINSDECSKHRYGCVLLISVSVSPNSWYIDLYNSSNSTSVSMTTLYGEDGFFSIVASSELGLLRSEEV